MQPQQQRKRPMRIRYTNRLKCLLCYIIVFSIPLLWQWAALAWIYPYKLAATAPELAEALQFAKTASDGSLRSMLDAREANWLMLVTLMAFAAWAVTLLIQLFWRFLHCKTGGFRAYRRAVHTCRLTALLILGADFSFAAMLWQCGVRLIAGRTVWDLVCYFIFYLLLPLCAVVVSRLAAPSVLSGKHAFFKRL